MNRYQEFIHDLLENYSLPENLTEELEQMRAPQVIDSESESPRTTSSAQEHLPIKDDTLEITHPKHKEKIPILDFSKLNNEEQEIVEGPDFINSDEAEDLCAALD